MESCDTFNVEASFPTLDEARRLVIDEIKLEAVPELRGDPDLNATHEGVTVLWLK